MNTRRYPRTLAEAFGPYTSQRIEPAPERISTADRVLGALLATVIGTLFAAALIHWLAGG